MLAIPAFRRLWLAQLGSQLGEAIALVAMPLLVYGLTGSAELLSLIFILQLLPRVLLAPIAMQTYLAEAVPDALRGRVYATWIGAVTLAGAAGFGLVGWLTPRLGPPAALALVGALVGIGGPLLLLGTGAIAAMRCEAASRA